MHRRPIDMTTPYRVQDPAVAIDLDGIQFDCGAIVVGSNDVQPIGHINGILALAPHECNPNVLALTQH